jgi:hypothetical protein
MEQARFAHDNTPGAHIIDIPAVKAVIPGGLDSPITSFATSEETKVVEDPIAASIPDGGFRAWLVVVGGFLDFAIAFGKVACFYILF